ncbi:MAG: tRNA pseudouridine(55) synthase TruB [Bacilli bacterium]|nr:tRNA pseudouridine(55) synthase TruB [Bacilli bacterium]
MNGILVVNKPNGITSRDVVNELCKILDTKKIGHTGTLDPIAQGVLVLCIGKATKLVEIITSNDKEYVAEVKLGVLTDTLDLDGNVIEERKITLNKNELKDTLNSFVGKYNQEVPIYSAVKINGKKLYEYARNNEEVTLPKREVEIKKIKLLELTNDSYKFKVLVSKGTYIRSLIKDINDKLGIIGSMSSLIRTKQGKFDINDSYTLEDIKNNNYKLLSINDVLKNEKCVIIDDNLYNVIKNGGIIDNIYKDNLITFIYKDNVIAIYKTYEKDNRKMKPYKMFI